MTACADGPEGVCLTCSDQALPALVVRPLDDGLAVVEIDGVREEVSVALVDAAAGDTVLVHAKEALAVIARAGDVPEGSGARRANDHPKGSGDPRRSGDAKGGGDGHG
ncbi:HypC/HybG/HupF family hydrogenase formation chaperone [Sphaerisporangium perillae]|uniref:HypC/HybG/HupF family hydrogenase formation chaperone n=1 Tax=Sphaerisporangium perillae TaxID=2935860 RepID=UPI00200DCF56|nr:HypC/HybG/HupF family hydrogenase formation chaperone [Sphaerisporangium perillae]